MTRRNQDIDFTRGQRVRVGGFDGPKGTMRWCKGRYWAVQLTDGTWAYPWKCGEIVADADGPHVCRCDDCGIRFRSRDPHAIACPACAPANRPNFDADRPIRDHARYHGEVQRRRKQTPTTAVAEETRPPAAPLDPSGFDDSDPPY
jgi:hypothetical protein